VKKISEIVSKVEMGMSRLETRMCKLEVGMSKLETSLSKLERDVSELKTLKTDIAKNDDYILKRSSGRILVKVIRSFDSGLEALAMGSDDAELAEVGLLYKKTCIDAKRKLTEVEVLKRFIGVLGFKRGKRGQLKDSLVRTKVDGTRVFLTGEIKSSTKSLHRAKQQFETRLDLIEWAFLPYG
jgi:exonuclease VII small subunit